MKTAATVLLLSVSLPFACGSLALAQVAAPAPPQAAQSVQPLNMSKQDVERLRAYQERIAEAVRKIPAGASLAELVRPIMQLAMARSTAGSAEAENRSAILAIAFYVNGRSLAILVPEAREWPQAERRGLRLGGRNDLAQHFTISAAVSSSAGAALADFIGLYKEFDDARRGSGFSFADLAADRAGTVFGQVATATLESARRLQIRVGTGLADTDMMPDVAGLPEGVSSEEFTRLYRGAGAPAYGKIVEDIERRIAALSLFQNPG
jgi:hypothetical protein